MTDPAIKIVEILREARLSASSEAALQSTIDDVLSRAGVSFEAEKRMGAGSRIDFLCNEGVGIEAKVKYPKRGIYRQLERYAAREEIKALILVTGTALGMPPEIKGKPLFYVSIGRSSL
jgi:hypothetical protein